VIRFVAAQSIEERVIRLQKAGPSKSSMANACLSNARGVGADEGKMQLYEIFGTTD
jgi:hypothetical protein